jgi:UDP-3-O-[3-hydroxymyristoyl] glucosamine N-acyltransferase
VVGGQVAISGHISIADSVSIGGQSGVISTVKEEDAKLFGTPAFNYKDNLRSQAIYRKLPLLEKRISDLEKLLKDTQK